MQKVVKFYNNRFILFTGTEFLIFIFEKYLFLFSFGNNFFHHHNISILIYN